RQKAAVSGSKATLVGEKNPSANRASSCVAIKTGIFTAPAISRMRPSSLSLPFRAHTTYSRWHRSYPKTRGNAIRTSPRISSIVLPARLLSSS
ncbi:unnamed protein product, partial [Mycena citricolor]